MKIKFKIPKLILKIILLLGILAILCILYFKMKKYIEGNRNFQKVEKNTDFLGNDMLNGYFSLTNLKNCKKECLKRTNPLCVGITTTFKKGECSMLVKTGY